MEWVAAFFAGGALIAAIIEGSEGKYEWAVFLVFVALVLFSFAVFG